MGAGGQAESQVAPPGATAKAAGAVGADPLWHPELPEDRQLAGGHYVMPEGTDKVVSARQDKSSKPRPQATAQRHKLPDAEQPCQHFHALLHPPAVLHMA